MMRSFRNKFFKYYLLADRDLGAEDLSALLLYFALSFIENKNGLNKLFSNTSFVNRTLSELAESEIIFLGSKLLELLNEVLPARLHNIMMIPNRVSWFKAKQFFAEQNHNNFCGDIANLGFAYQIFSSYDRTKKALPALQKANKKITRQELIAFTQLYTPTWVVDFLVSNAILWGNEKEKISDRYSDWLIPNRIERDKIALRELTVLDPACGAGQFLFSVFDLLMEVYLQQGYEKQIAAKQILEKNIFAADIDEKALWVAGLGLLSKYLTFGESNNLMSIKLNNLAWISASDIDENLDENSFLGSIDTRLSDKHFLKNNYSVIVTNPPYLGRRSMSREIKTVLKNQYLHSSADLSAAFLERCLGMLEPDGSLGIITQSSLMSIPSYKILRQYLLENFSMQAVVHCGPGVFPLASGEKIDSILLLVKRSGTVKEELLRNKTYFANLSTERNKAIKLASVIRSSDYIEQSNFFDGIPDNVLSKFSPDFHKKISLLPKLADIAQVRQGLATTNNKRFVRYIFDVDQDLVGNTWIPYIKGAGSERYANHNPFVVKWGKNGQEIKEAVDRAYPYLRGKIAWVVKNEEFYFRSGLCFSFINKSGLAVRRLPAGAIFDVASSAIFTLPEEEGFLLAYLNSKIISLLVKNINQTINIQVGDLKKIPIIPLSKDTKDELNKLGNLAFEKKNEILNFALSLLTAEPNKISAGNLSAILEHYKNEQTRLAEELSLIQNDIDNKIINAMDGTSIINPGEKQILFGHLAKFEKLEFSEKEGAFKIFSLMVSKIVSSRPPDRLVLISSMNNKNLSKLFGLTDDGLDWFEGKLGNSIERILSGTKVTDISKLAQEPSRYFSYYFGDYNSCMFFSSAAARRFKKDGAIKNIFCQQEIDSNGDLFAEVNILWSRVFSQLDTIIDWTSKDLFGAFKSITF